MAEYWNEKPLPPAKGAVRAVESSRFGPAKRERDQLKIVLK